MKSLEEACVPSLLNDRLSSAIISIISEFLVDNFSTIKYNHRPLLSLTKGGIKIKYTQRQTL